MSKIISDEAVIPIDTPVVAWVCKTGKFKKFNTKRDWKAPIFSAISHYATNENGLSEDINDKSYYFFGLPDSTGYYGFYVRQEYVRPI